MWVEQCLASTELCMLARLDDTPGFPAGEGNYAKGSTTDCSSAIDSTYAGVLSWPFPASSTASSEHAAGAGGLKDRLVLCTADHRARLERDTMYHAEPLLPALRAANIIDQMSAALAIRVSSNHSIAVSMRVRMHR